MWIWPVQKACGELGNEGVARQEGVNINLGLLSINKVVMSMAAGHTVIPYRDSVLTTVLQGKCYVLDRLMLN